MVTSNAMPHLQLSDVLPFLRVLSPSSLYSRHKTHVHVAFLFSPRKKLLSWAVNKVGSRSLGSGYSGQTIHAERAVLKRVGDVTKLRGASLVVVRVGIQGNIKTSQPCSECKCHLDKCIREYGLKYVYHS